MVGPLDFVGAPAPVLALSKERKVKEVCPQSTRLLRHVLTHGSGGVGGGDSGGAVDIGLLAHLDVRERLALLLRLGRLAVGSWAECGAGICGGSRSASGEGPRAGPGSGGAAAGGARQHGEASRGGRTAAEGCTYVLPVDDLGAGIVEVLCTAHGLLPYGSSTEEQQQDGTAVDGGEGEAQRGGGAADGGGGVGALWLKAGVGRAGRVAVQAEWWRLVAAAVRGCLRPPWGNMLECPAPWLQIDGLPEVPEAEFPSRAPPRVAAALAGGYLPCLERLLRRGAEDRQGSEAQLVPQVLRSQPLAWRALPWLLAYSDVRQGASLIATLRKVLLRARDQLGASPWVHLLGASVVAAADGHAVCAPPHVDVCCILLVHFRESPHSSPAAPPLAPCSAPAAPSPGPAPEPTLHPSCPGAAASHTSAATTAAAEPAHRWGAGPRPIEAALEAVQPAAKAAASGAAIAPPGVRGSDLDVCAVCAVVPPTTPDAAPRLCGSLACAIHGRVPVECDKLAASGSSSGSGSRPGRAQKRGPQAPRGALQPLHQRSILWEQSLERLWSPLLSWLAVLGFECLAGEVGMEEAAGAAGAAAGGASSGSSNGSGSSSSGMNATAASCAGGGGGGSGGGEEGRGSGGSGGGGGGVRPNPRAVADACRQMAPRDMDAIGLAGAALRQTVPLAVQDPPACQLVMPALATALCYLAAAFPDEVRQAVEGTVHVAESLSQDAPGSAGAVRGGAAAAAAAGAGGGGGRSAGASASAGGGSGAVDVSGEVWPRQLVSRLAAYLRGQQQQQDGQARYPNLMVALGALEALLELWGSGRVPREGGEEQEEQQQRMHLAGVSALRAAVCAMGSMPGASVLVGGVHVGPGELRRGLLLRACAYPACVSVEGDSEAEAEGRLVACGRGCGAAWYCCQECMEAHCREGHERSCGAGR